MTRKPPAKKPVAKKQPAKSKAKAAIKPPDSGKANRYFVLFFFLFALALYGNTILNKYAVDDEFVTHNDLVKKGFAAIPKIFTTPYLVQKGNVGNQASDYRPVVKLTFAIEYQLYGEKPGISHAINILLYFWLSSVLFFILKRLLKNYNILFPFLITVIFMAHPVHTEVVASLKNRDEMISFLCALGGLWCLLKYADTRRIWYVLATMVLFFTGYLSKSSIMPFILLYPLVLYFFTGLKPGTYIPIFLAILAVALFAHFLPKMIIPWTPRVNSLIENPLYFDKNLWHRFGTGLVSLLFYLRILVYPNPLLYYYGYDMIPVVTPLNLWAILSFILYTALLGWALLKAGEKHLISFAILWYLVAISMYSNVLVPVVGIVGERFVFVASLGFCIALVWVIFRIFRTDPKSLTIEFDARAKIIVIIALVLIPYVARTVTRNRDWRNLFTLYSKDIDSQVNSAKANNQYAGFLMNSVYKDPNFLKTGDVNQYETEVIISHFRRSLEIYPDNYQTVNDLGSVYLFFGKKPDSAIAFLKKATEMRPDLIPAWVNLGMSYRELKQYDKALECYETILRRDPQELRATFALANVYNDMGNFDKAMSINEEMIRKYPRLDIPYINIGNYYLQRGDTAKAVANWQTAVEKRPTYEGFMQLNRMYKIHGDQQKADYYLHMAQQFMNQNKP
jgi:protein O-mannosyl-transferase